MQIAGPEAGRQGMLKMTSSRIRNKKTRINASTTINNNKIKIPQARMKAGKQYK